MADDKKNIGPEDEKPGEAPQEKKTEPIKDTPPAPEQPAPGTAEAPVVEAVPKAQPTPTVENQPEEKAAPAPKVLDFVVVKYKAPTKEETTPEKMPVKEQTEEKANYLKMRMEAIKHQGGSSLGEDAGKTSQK